MLSMSQHVKGVERSPKYIVKAVMLCMSKVLKEAQNQTIWASFDTFVMRLCGITNSNNDAILSFFQQL